MAYEAKETEIKETEAKETETHPASRSAGRPHPRRALSTHTHMTQIYWRPTLTHAGSAASDVVKSSTEC